MIFTMLIFLLIMFGVFLQLHVLITHILKLKFYFKLLSVNDVMRSSRSGGMLKHTLLTQQKDVLIN